MATLRLTNVTKIYDNDFIAVDGFDLDVKDKEFIVLVGPSGCGKSTTLRMIAGLESITEGTIEIDGEVVNDLQPKDRGIAMVFQNYALFPHLTVYDNIAFSLRLRKVPEDIIEKKVREVAEVLGISEHLSKKPKALSGGQKQRVAIGRAMVRDSSVFLLDEPLSNLDAKLRNQMRAELILLRERLNTTFIYVTHDQTEAMTLGDRIVVMKDGRIMQVGTPAEVFNSPKNLFVATFIGSPAMNVLDARLVKTGDRFAVEYLGAVMPVGFEKDAALAECQEVYGDMDLWASDIHKPIKLGIRPEHISISREPSAKAFPAIVLVNEMMGSELQLHVRTENGDTVVVRVATKDLSQEHAAALTSGSRIYLSFDGPFMHFFDPETEENILSELYN